LYVDHLDVGNAADADMKVRRCVRMGPSRVASIA
jgi:hypothetical protein